MWGFMKDIISLVMQKYEYIDGNREASLATRSMVSLSERPI